MPRNLESSCRQLELLYPMQVRSLLWRSPQNISVDMCVKNAITYHDVKGR